MLFKDIIKGLNNGSITIIENGHVTNSLVEKLESYLEHWEEKKKEYEDKIAKGIMKDDNVDCASMLNLYKRNIEENIENGDYINAMAIEQYCFNCGEEMYVFLIDEKTIGYIPCHLYWKIAEASGNKHGYKVKKEDCQDCEAKPLLDAKKLVSEIQCPSGRLVFKNHFNKEKIYEVPRKSEYRDSINSLLGRNHLMQYLATQNVGYGQMGNMSVTIYSNDKDEILVGDSLEGYRDNKSYYKSHLHEIDEEWKKESQDAEAFIKILKKGKFKNCGSISLSVWRWMCADLEVLRQHGEEVTPYGDKVFLNVEPGRYRIEHYYDFSENGRYLYSRLNKIYEAESR